MNLIPIFPVGIGKDVIELDSNYKLELINNVINQEKLNKINIDAQSSWTGDTNNNEYLHNIKLYEKLYTQINEKLKIYIRSLGYKEESLNIYFERSWATVSRNTQQIALHAHLQSHISFAYYLSLPTGSGNLEFYNDRSYNELINGTFSKPKLLLELTTNLNQYNAPSIQINIQENEIYFFPSKLKHRTTVGDNTEPRISMSSDIVVTLKKERNNTELGMADIANWKKFT